MRKSAYKTITILFLMHFLVWMQLGAAQLYCQCEHSIAEESCHASQNKISDDSCCENPETSKTENHHNDAPMSCHDMAMEDADAKGSSCCLNDNETAAAYFSSAHYCQTACVNVVPAQSKQVVLPDPGKKMQYLPLLQKVDNRNSTAIESSSYSAFHEFEIPPHSPPLFIMHSSFLI